MLLKPADIYRRVEEYNAGKAVVRRKPADYSRRVEEYQADRPGLPRYAGLTTLDVSKNTMLETLWCYDNQLTTLDVSKNTKLTELYCIFNQLTTLDVSKNTKLTELYCYGNQLTDVALQSLVNSLPTTTDGDFRPLSSVEDETNALMSKAQVAQAKAKGWDTYYYNDDSGQWGKWELYPGIDGITIDATTFPDEAFRNYVSTKIDNGDGMLVDSERDAVTEITIEFKGVSSMEGIGYFPNLSKLSCTEQQAYIS